MDKNKEAYLKCNYSEGMFSHEYFVEFNGSHYPGNLGGVFVDKRNLKCNDENPDENSGLVRITIARKNEDGKTSQVLVTAVTDDGHFFRVPNEDIVCLDKN